MPTSATRDQRIKWYAAHARVCGGRAVPESVRQDVARLTKTRRKPS